MWPFIIYGGLNGLLYAYGLLLPIFVFLLNTRHHKIGIFVLLSIPFVMLNIVSGWHGKGIIGSYILSILFIMAVKYRFIFWLSIAVSLCALAVSNIDYDRLFEMVFSNARSLEYINIMSLGYSEAPSVESLYIRLYYLYGLPAVVSSVIIVACCLWLGLIAYVYSSPQNAELWLFVFFLFSFFATTFLTTTLFSLFVPSVFLAWSFYFYIVANNRHLVPSKLKSSS
jgi:hypothetical protein